MKITAIFLLLVFTSCASYVNNLHRQIENEENSLRMQRMRQAQKIGDQRPIQNPITLNDIASANNQKNNYPNVKRQYNSPGARRYKADDLVDNQSDGSLWSGKNSESFLFVNNNLKQKGDIVIVEVLKGLKEKIQDELKRNFPDSPKAKSKTDDNDKKEEPAPSVSSGSGPENANKVFDKISTVVIEQVNQDYLLIRGRKEVMYKDFKRYFEIQAIVSQKDVSSRDAVSSIKLLEPKINVLRY